MLLQLLYICLLAWLQQNSNSWFSPSASIQSEHKQDVITVGRWTHSVSSWKMEIKKILQLEPRIDLSAGGNIFEIGCGSCAFLNVIHDQYPHVNISGNDINKDILSICKSKHPDAHFYQGDFCQIDHAQLPPMKFICGNGVLSYFNSLEHVMRTLRLCDAVLEPKGGMLFTMLDPTCTWKNILTFTCSLTSGTLRIPPSIFIRFAQEFNYEIHVHFSHLMHGQYGNRYIVAMRKRSPQTSPMARNTGRCLN